MRVHLIKEETIHEYIREQSISQRAFDNWLNRLRIADWEIPQDIINTFGTRGDIIGRRRVIFDVGGNNYRMICSYHFGRRNVHLYINWIGTHAEYDKLCRRNEAEGNQYTISKY